MGRASCIAALLRALLPLLLPLLLLLLLRPTTTRALGPRISVPLGKYRVSSRGKGARAARRLVREATKKEWLRSNRSPSPFRMLWSKRKGREAREPRAPFFLFFKKVDLEKATHSLCCSCLSPRGGTLGTVGGAQVLAVLPIHLLVFDDDQSQPRQGA